ncbi:MAG TPA: IMP dehydrogenase [Myxococcales bacterium]|nr:IMP dehydrogenase [Myxococcales bacterium]HAN31175.1 IMP dehydrogenase [Myxococcales bacterium]
MSSVPSDHAHRFHGDGLALTYDDVLMVPAHSQVLPRDVALKSQLTRDLTLAVPVFAAAMDTVSESAMAIAMARLGGMAVIHKNLSVQAQAAEVAKVKAADPRFDRDVQTLSPQDACADASVLMREQGQSAMAVLQQGRVVGVLTRRALLRGEERGEVGDLMLPAQGVVSHQISPDAAVEVMAESGVSRLFVIGDDERFLGVMTQAHLDPWLQWRHAVRDAQGRLQCAAAVGPSGDCDERIAALVGQGCDVVVIDTAHGHSQNVLDAVRRSRTNYPNLVIVAGNVATGQAVRALAEAGADVVKVGIGPGSICTTRIVAGVGVPQMSAVLECAAVAKEVGVTVIADGGIKHSGDIVKAIAAGGSAIMVGSLLAGTDESPGEEIIIDGIRYKAYRGMGSLGAMQQGSKDRYFQEQTADAGKLVPEGVEARVPSKGPVASVVHQLMGGLRAGMGYTGCADLESLGTEAKFVRITNAGLAESHVHDVVMSSPAPNYVPRRG